MRSVRTVLFAIGTLITLLTFVGFAMFSPNTVEPRPEEVVEATTTTIAGDTGLLTGRVTAFVFANELQSVASEEAAEEPGAEEPGAKIPARQTLFASALTTTTTTTAPPTTTTTAPPTTTTTASPASGPLTESQMRALVTQYFPAEEVEKAVLIARCESGYNPNAVSSNGHYGGLFQHSFAYWDGRAAAAGWAGASIFDPAANTAVSAWLLNQGGWDHWPNCSVWADSQLGG